MVPVDARISARVSFSSRIFDYPKEGSPTFAAILGKHNRVGNMIGSIRVATAFERRLAACQNPISIHHADLGIQDHSERANNPKVPHGSPEINTVARTVRPWQCHAPLDIQSDVAYESKHPGFFLDGGRISCTQLPLYGDLR